MAIRCELIIEQRPMGIAFPRPKTASGGLRYIPRHRFGRTRLQPTGAPWKNRLRYDLVRRGAVLPQNQQQQKPKSRLSCLGSALWENKSGFILDGLGWAANFALPEGSAAVAIAGSAIGVAGLGAAIANNKGPGDAAVAGSLAMTGKYAAGAEGILRGAGSAIGHRIGVAALTASTAYDAAKTALDYNACMSGN